MLETTILKQDELLDKVKVLFFDKFRLVAMSPLKSDENVEIIYTFASDYDMESFRIVVDDLTKEVPSISSVYQIAFLYENEIKDLYGVKFQGLVLDFNGNFYQTKIKTPFI